MSETEINMDKEQGWQDTDAESEPTESSSNTELDKFSEKVNTEDEQEVVSYLSSVDANSTQYNGMCGRITDVSFREPEEETEEIRQIVRRISDETERFDDEVRTNNEIKDIAKVQQKLEEAVGLAQGDTKKIDVEVELPDSRRFTQIFEPPTFNSPESENQFLLLYENVLGLDVKEQESAIGEVVPVHSVSSSSEREEFQITTSASARREKALNRSETPGEAGLVIGGVVIVLTIVGLLVMTV